MVDTIKKILFLLPPSDKWKVVGLLLLMIVGSILEVIGIGMIPIFVSIVATPDRIFDLEHIQPILEFMGIQNKRDILIYGGVALVGVFVFKNVYIIWFSYVKSRFLYNRYASISRQLFKKYMDSSYTFITSKNTAEIVRNVTQDTGSVVGHIMEPMLKLAMDMILISATLALLFWVSPLITIAAVVLFLAGGGGFLRAVRSRAQSHGKRVQLERAIMMRCVNEGLGGLKDIRVLQRTGWFLARFNKSVVSFGRAQVYRSMSRAATKPVLETVAVTGMLVVVLILSSQGGSVDSIIPLVALFGAAALRLLPSMRELVEAVNNLRFYRYSIDPIYEEFKRTESTGRNHIPASDDGPGSLEFNRKIRFEGVSFSYPGRGLPAVSDISLTIEKGSAVGFIGPSGAGKTTVVDLLLGILEPESGRIKVDGVSIHDHLGPWLRNVGYIPQFIFLTDDTLRRNIALGLPDEKIEEDRLLRAIESAQLAETIDLLPDGLDTIVGERGVRLSGGQRQRIGIARALYGDPSVLIMDEATSSLDSATEKYVIDAIERLKGARTIIMISHRLTTVQNCDRLFIINNGQLADSGAYQDLMERNSELCPVRV